MPTNETFNYRGFKVDKQNVIQTNYNIGSGRAQKTRKIGYVYIATYPDSGALKTFKTLKALKTYVDNYIDSNS